MHRTNKNMWRRRASAAVADIDFEGMSDVSDEDEDAE